MLLGHAVFNMSNTLSWGTNCALLDAASLTERLTSHTYERHSPTEMNAYVKESIERRLNERQCSYLMQKIVFPGRSSMKGFVRNMTLPLPLRQIDALDHDPHVGDKVWVEDDSLWNERCVSLQCVKELR